MKGLEGAEPFRRLATLFPSVLPRFPPFWLVLGAFVLYLVDYVRFLYRGWYSMAHSLVECENK